VFHNDDYTTQEFVVHVLVAVFHKDEMAAFAIMLEVHHRGWGVAGVYSRDVAETKVEQVLNYARERGHPLKVSAEPEGYEG
jgi:ATP-dependent Clp protease adaptor protein ClpS